MCWWIKFFSYKPTCLWFVRYCLYSPAFNFPCSGKFEMTSYHMISYRQMSIRCSGLIAIIRNFLRLVVQSKLLCYVIPVLFCCSENSIACLHRGTFFIEAQSTLFICFCILALGFELLSVVTIDSQREVRMCLEAMVAFPRRSTLSSHLAKLVNWHFYILLF